MADPDSVARAFQQIQDRFGWVDVLVSNAWALPGCSGLQMTNKQFDQVLKVSLYSTFSVKQVIDGMRAGLRADYFHVSTANRGVMGGQAITYAAGGIIGLTKT